MEINLNKNALFFMDLRALMMINRSKEVFVHNGMAFVSTPNVVLCFRSIDYNIADGRYKVTERTPSQFTLELMPDAEVRLPDLDMNFIECESVKCVPGMKLEVPTAVKNAILSRMLGKTLDVFYQEGAGLITCDNMYVILLPKIETTAKMLINIPESTIEKVARSARANGTSMNAEMINMLKRKSVVLQTTSAPAITKESTVNKMLQGIPQSHMAALTERSATTGISVNKIILGLIETSITGVAPSLKSPSPSFKGRNKLLAGIPLTLMDTLRTNAAASNLSVNKYILEVLKNA